MNLTGREGRMRLPETAATGSEFRSFPEVIRINRDKFDTSGKSGYNNIIARTDKARAEKSAAGFLFEKFQSDAGRTSRRLISSPSPKRRKPCRRPSLFL